MKSINLAIKPNQICTVITDVAEMATLRQEWDALWLRAKGSAFQTYSLALHSWNEVAGPKGHSLFCVVVREAGHLSLVFPLVRYRRGPYWILRPLGPNSVKITDVLLDPNADAQKTIRLAWSTIESRSRAAVIDVPHVKVGSELHRHIQSKRHVSHDADIAPYASFHDQTDWDTLVKVAGLNAKQQLNRKRKRLGEIGNLEFLEVDPVADPKHATELLDWMFAEKRRWAERVGKNGHWLTSDDYGRFLVNWVTDPAAAAQNRVYALLVDKLPIAVSVASFCLSHIDGIIAGFHSDQKFAKYSPGLVLDEFVMRAAFDRRLDVDFGIGAEAYKLQWSRNAKIDVVSYHIPQTLSGAAIAKWWHVKRKIEARSSERSRETRIHETTA